MRLSSKDAAFAREAVVAFSVIQCIELLPTLNFMHCHYLLTFLHLVSECDLVAFGANADLVAIPVFSEAYLEAHAVNRVFTSSVAAIGGRSDRIML